MSIENNTLSLLEFVIRQCGTLGVRPLVVEEDRWVPQLPGAEERCLGVLGRFKGEREVYYPIIALLRNNQNLICSHSDGYLRNWNLKTGEIIWKSEQKHKNDSPVNFTISQNEELLISGQVSDSDIILWDTKKGYKKLNINGPNEAKSIFFWSEEYSYIFCGTLFGENNAYVIDTNSWQIKMISSPDKGGFDWAFGHSTSMKYFATGDQNGLICIWESKTKKIIKQWNIINESIWNIKWSPDEKKVLVGYGGIENSILILNILTGQVIFKNNFTTEETSGVSALDWSPDGSYFAIGERKGTKGKSHLRIWNFKNKKEVFSSSLEVASISKLQWASNGAFIVSGHFDNTIRFWDTRHFLPSKIIIPKNKKTTKKKQQLLSAFLQVHQLNLACPISVLKDLLQLCSGQNVQSKLNNLKQYLESFISLQWPFHARIGLVAWLLKDHPFPQWQLSANTDLSTLEDTLYNAMLGETIEAELPDLPLALLTEACKKINPQLITLLKILGPKAVAEDPGLPLRLSAQIPEIPKLNLKQRRLLGLRLSFDGSSGQSSGYAPNADRSIVDGIDMGGFRSDWRSLLPSQLILPQSVFQYRQLRGELLFRSRQIMEPPQLRPTVLVLDVSPPTFGAVEKITRLAAYTISKSLHEAGLPIQVVTTSDKADGKPRILDIRHPADLVSLFTQRSLFPMEARKSLEVASALRYSLKSGNGLEPIVIVLTHPWFGLEEDLSEFSGLRALVVQYPGQQIHPPLSKHYDKCESVIANQSTGLEQILGRLIS